MKRIGERLQQAAVIAWSWEVGISGGEPDLCHLCACGDHHLEKLESHRNISSHSTNKSLANATGFNCFERDTVWPRFILQVKVRSTT